MLNFGKNFRGILLLSNIPCVEGNMTPIPGSDNSKEDENEAVVPFPFSNFEAPHEHPTGLLEATGG